MRGHSIADSTWGDDKCWTCREVGQGKIVLSQHGTEFGAFDIGCGDPTPQIDRQKIAVKWCASGAGAGIGAGRGSQSLSNKRGATNMRGGRDRSQ
jgi:hypothetical protein